MLVKGLSALRISAEVKRLELLASNTAIRILRLPNQILDLRQSHADLQFGEFAVGSGCANDFPIDCAIR